MIFFKLVRESFLNIPSAHWDLGNISKHVFHIAFDPNLSDLRSQIPTKCQKLWKFRKIPKKSFSKLGRESFLHIPCTLRELSDTSRHVFHIDFAPKSHCQAPSPPKPRAEKWNISKICVKLVSKTHPLCSLRARRLSKHAFLPSSLKALPVPCRPGSSTWSGVSFWIYIQILLLSKQLLGC